MIDNKPLLLVEDDDLDAKKVERAFRELQVANPVARVTNGEEALAWLRDPARGRPGLILSDLNLPIMSGIELIQVVKGDESLRQIPVVVLTASRLETDKLASFHLSVAGYMVKPVDYPQFVELMRTVHLYWTRSETP